MMRNTIRSDDLPSAYKMLYIRAQFFMPDRALRVGREQGRVRCLGCDSDDPQAVAAQARRLELVVFASATTW